MSMVDVSKLSARQIENARLIYDAAEPWGAEVQVAALMCAGDESSWLRYANDGSTTRSDVDRKWRDLARTSLNYPHDAVAGADFTSADSIGLFQQRPMFDYGTVAQLMDPAESTRIFVRGSHAGAGSTRYYLQAPSNLTMAQRIQWTQGSEFPTGDNYVPFERVARQILAEFRATAPAQSIRGWIAMSEPDQGKLDAFADEVASKVVWYKINDTNVADLAYNNRHYTANAVQVILQDDFDGNTADLETLSVSLALTGFPLQLVAVSDSNTGAIYATDGASVFRHVKDVGVLAAGVAAKLWTGTAAPVTCVQRDLLYAFVAQPNGLFPDPS